MNPPARLSLFAVLTILLFAGCGGDEKTTTTATRTTPTAADRAIARAAVLKPSDLPTGWTASEREAATAIDCLPFNRMQAQAYAEARDYNRRDGAFARNGVAIFPSSEDVERVVTAAAADATLTCLADAVRRAAVEGARHLAIGEVTATRLDDPGAGEHSSAVRVTIPLRAEGRHVDVTADYVHVAVGRGISTLVLGGAGLVPDAGVRLQLTLRTAERLDSALGGAS